MASYQELRKAIENTTKQFLGAYKDAGEQNNPAIINRDVTDSCKRYFKPAGVLQLFGSPPEDGLNNADYEAAMALDLKKYVVTYSDISDLTIDTEARKSGATNVTGMLYKSGEADVIEHSWVLDFNEDGSKVTKVIEFCDTDGLRRMFAKVYNNTEDSI
ncbi:hypothetical protein ACKAV7_013105 [Fusarium commune]|uniref:SnoaL-like domain-containing protein n=1 Tax=Fusarium oxysporum f. sp. rapae TaxID=485398 RepID=A0A8J5NQY0_FUSOX|nr:hypothetical protein Forpe1208_v015514 [Fusarium oxysporum f. sp. rapae]